MMQAAVETRRAKTVTALLTVVALAHCGASVAAQAATPSPGIAGTWVPSAYSARLVPMDGKEVPFTPAARDAYGKTRAALASGKLTDTSHSLCLVGGTPRTLLAPYPFRVFQTARQVVFIHEANRAFRIVQLTDHHADPDIWDPSFMGEGIGRWEGDVLVIDSANFNDKTWLDDTSLPHGTQLHVIERLRTLANGKELEDVVTIEDPDHYTRAWSARLSFRLDPAVRIVTDWVCGEPHRSVASVKGAKAYR